MNVVEMAQRLERWIERDPNSGCWLWSGANDGEYGYGKVWHNGKYRYAHRVSFETFVGNADGMFICHRCDTPACINPDHLWIGTHTDNMRDASRKGRFKTEKRRANSHNIVKNRHEGWGETHYKAKLSNEKVAELRKEFDNGVKVGQLYKKYGITRNSAYQIANRITRQEQP